MTTISFKQFSQGKPVQVVGNEQRVQSQEATDGRPSFFDGLSRVADVYTKNLKEQALGGVQNAQKSFGMGVDTMQQAQQMPIGTEQQREQAFGKASAGALQTGVGAMSGTIQTVFSPLTALIQTGVQGLSELDQATGGKIKNQLVTLAQEHPDLVKKYSDIVTQNPKMAQFVSDSINVLTAGLGAKPVAEAGKDLTKGLVADTKEAVSTSLNKTGTAFDSVKTLPTNFANKAVDLVSADPEKKVATILKESTPAELDAQLAVAEKAATDPRLPTPYEVTGKKLAETVPFIQNKLNKIGQAKSDIVSATREGLSPFVNETKPLISKLTSLKNSFSEIDKANAGIVDSIVADAKTVSTKLDADKFIDKVQDALYSGNRTMSIPQGSALDKQLRGIIGEYNSSLKSALPKEYAALNEQYSKMLENLSVINRSIGETVDGVPLQGASLIKQFFSPSGTKAKEIFDFVKKETNGQVDLAKDATLAKFSMELFDDPRAKSLLQGIPDIPTTLTGVVGKVAEKLGGQKLQSAMRTSTIRKAKEISSPKLELKNSSKIISPTESKVLPSLNTTPTVKKGKGIRGMINFDEIMKSLIPTKKLLTEAKDSVSQLESAISFIKSAKSPQAIIDFRKELSDVMTKMGRDTVITNNNYKKILQEAEDMVSQLKAHIKSSESKSASSVMNREFDTKKKVASEVPKTKVISPLEQEAKKYKSAEEFYQAKKTQEYAMSHRPTEGVRAFDLTEKVDGEQMIPNDMYEQWYGSRGTKADMESIAVLKKIKGNPEANVTIYRASPKESFNNGDWVSFSKSYAQEHADGNGTKVHSKVVKAKDVRWAMDDVNEFGYYPENYKSQLTDIWKKANKK